MQAQSKIEFSHFSADTLHAAISGTWKISSKLPAPEEVFNQLATDPRIKNIIINASDLKGWDTTFLTFINAISKECQKENIRFEIQELPKGAKRLLRIASAVSEQKDAYQKRKRKSFLYMVGDSAVVFGTSIVDVVSFIGEASQAVVRFFFGKARFRRIDFLIYIEDCGAQSLPIVTLISLLVGLILAFVGAVQLKMFGAQIYVANLVAIAMVREMGALMTGIIMAGRIGAAYAAQLGTMQVNEEIDALNTMGISPMDFLVLPRLFALALMMPLLTLYSDLLGILGGAIVGVGMMDITPMQYFTQTQASLDMTNISLGIAKGGIYGIIIALAGCLRGMQSGRSAAAVGEATTAAVVTAIVHIIITDGIFAVLCDALGI
ncbi:MAG: MlaE family lipid ABC transporter permease subunit [Desulfobacterales bacterium]|nr:MlaE family lipid ABC transporter permease subunit [Desulfobacterales bacterium]